MAIVHTRLDHMVDIDGYPYEYDNTKPFSDSWERRLEFATEGFRFFDLVCCGIAEPVLNTYINV